MFVGVTSIEPVLRKKQSSTEEKHLTEAPEDPEHVRQVEKEMNMIASHIQKGANSFLAAEYRYMFWFMLGFSAILLIAIGLGVNWTRAIFTVVAFNIGCAASIFSGWIGMYIATQANVRTCSEAYASAPKVLREPFLVAFMGGGVMGFGLVSLAVIALFGVVMVYVNFVFTDALGDSVEATQQMYESVAGFGLGGSSIALFGRVGGGIYTKAADVGADQVKLKGLKEDDPRNPAVIADNVGDNVGDVAGMGADLFGSLAESSCAAMIISASSPDVHNIWSVMCFPILIAACGIPVCIITSIFATGSFAPKDKNEVGMALKYQLVVSTVLMTPVFYWLCMTAFPSTPFEISTVKDATAVGVFVCLCLGLWSGLAIGLITEYYTSDLQPPVRNLAAESSAAALNIIQGLALGYESVILPIFCLAITIYVSYGQAGMYGIACGALGMLSTLATGLTIDAYGPICDNAGGIAEMSGMDEDVRDDKTDPLDAAGNTTAAIGKGFAIGSAALVSLALFGAFVTLMVPEGVPTVNVLEEVVFAGVLVGAMLPYWFSAMCMKSVGTAAGQMTKEVFRQFKELRLLEEGNTNIADYSKCIEISTKASLNQMIPPGILVMCTPLLVGYLIGTKCLAGLLVGILTSGVQVAISASNSGGAWDNAKKYIKDNGLVRGMKSEDQVKYCVISKTFVVRQGKDGTDLSENNTMLMNRIVDEAKAAWTSDDISFYAEKGAHSVYHNAAITGDTVGDPLKDTSGPALNILVKLSAITSVVFATSMPAWNDKGYLLRLFGN
jgi:inorganic pyrophosphatase